MKISIKCIVIIGAFFLSSYLVAEETKTSTFDKLAELALDNHKVVLNAAVLGLVLEVLLLSASDADHHAISTQLQPFALAKNIATNITKAFVVTLFHELGHALVAKMLNGSPIAIKLGANSMTKSTATLASFSGVSIVGLNFERGHTFFKRSDSLKQRALIKLAGPIAGLVANYCMKLLQELMQDDKDFSQGCLTALLPDYQDFQQVVNLAVPFADADAIDIYKSLGFTDQTIESIPKEFLVNLALGVWSFAECMRVCNAESQKTRLLIVLFNMVSRNYVRLRR